MTTAEKVIPETTITKLSEAFNSSKPLVDNAEPGKLFTNREAADYLRTSIVSFWKIRQDSNIQAVYSGKKMLFRKCDLDHYLHRDKKIYFSAREILEHFGINRLTILQWELDEKVRCYIVGEVVCYRLDEIYHAAKSDNKLKEVSNG